MGIYRTYKIKMAAAAILLAVFALLIAVDVFLLVRWADFKKTALTTEALITDIRREYNHRGGSSTSSDYDYYVTVLYNVDGVEYNRLLGYYMSSMREGQYIVINYDPDDPTRLMADPSFSCSILLLFIVITGGIGFWMLISELSNKKFINGLAAEDKYIVCDHSVERVEGDSYLTVNHVRYRQMDFIYRAPDGNEYVFSSRPYHPNKNPFIDGENVIVYVDIEKDPKKYYVSEGR